MDIMILSWIGPFYNKEEVKGIDLLSNGLYAFFGKEKYSHDDILLQYIGKTRGTFYKRWYHHTVPSRIFSDFSAWFAIINNRRQYDLNSIEHNFIYFCEPNLNNKCTVNLPNAKMLFISEFYKKDYIDKYYNKLDIEDCKYVKQKFYTKYIPNFIMWDGKTLRLSQSVIAIHKDNL